MFLGFTAGGIFPGTTYYVSLWYPHQLQTKHVSLFTSAASIAGAFGGILAYGIEKLDGCVQLTARNFSRTPLPHV